MCTTALVSANPRVQVDKPKESLPRGGDLTHPHSSLGRAGGVDLLVEPGQGEGLSSDPEQVALQLCTA